MLEYVLLGLLIVVVLFVIIIYNSLIILKNRIENAWAQIDVQTKKRFDLVPNLVEVVKGYAKHEKAVFTEITSARTAIMKAGSDIRAKAKAENMMSGALKSLFAVAENYPTLRASENFMQLQEEVSGIESKIAYARQFYNDSVLSFNAKIQTFPTNVLAGMFGFKEKQYFEIEEEARKNVKISF